MASSADVVDISSGGSSDGTQYEPSEQYVCYDCEMKDDLGCKLKGNDKI